MSKYFFATEFLLNLSRAVGLTISSTCRSMVSRCLRMEELGPVAVFSVSSVLSLATNPSAAFFTPKRCRKDYSDYYYPTFMNGLRSNYLRHFSRKFECYTVFFLFLTLLGCQPALRNNYSPEQLSGQQRDEDDTRRSAEARPGCAAWFPQNSLASFSSNSDSAWERSVDKYFNTSKILDVIDCGGNLLWLENGPTVVFAKVVRGSPKSRASTQSEFALSLSKQSLYKKEGETSAVDSATLSPNGDSAAFSTEDGIFVFEAEAALVNSHPQFIPRFSLRRERIPSKILQLIFHPARKELLIAAADGRIYLWKYEKESKVRGGDATNTLQRYSGPSTIVSAIAFHPAGRVFVTGDWDGELSAWLLFDESPDLLGKVPSDPFFGALYSERSIRSRAGGGEPIDLIRVSSDGMTIAFARRRGEVELWDVRGFKKRCDMENPLKFDITDLAVTEDGHAGWIINRDRELFRFDEPPKQEDIADDEEKVPCKIDVTPVPTKGRAVRILPFAGKMVVVTERGIEQIRLN